MEVCSSTYIQAVQSESFELLCWGSRELGQTGCGRPRGDVCHKWTCLRDCMGRVKLLACGSSHTVVVTVDNRIFTWGNGTSGQLGNGEKIVKDSPVEIWLPQEQDITGLDPDVGRLNVVGVACGSRHSFVWTDRGQAYSFGNNFYAQLGYDFRKADFKGNQLAPCLFQNLPPSLRISQVACGERHSLFVLEDGSVAACGMNDYGQIGSGSNESAVVPYFVEDLSGVSKVTCGANHSLALTGDRRLFQWGCGRACGKNNKNILFPEEVMSLSSPVVDMAGGCWHSLLLTDGGNVFSWGMGQEGQLGLGESKTQVSTPYLVSYSRVAGVSQIRAGDSYSVAVTAGGDLFLWGRIPPVSLESDRSSIQRVWIPQHSPLPGRNVYDVACGTCHVMVLTRSAEISSGAALADVGACFKDTFCNPPPTEGTERRHSEQVCFPSTHTFPQRPHARQDPRPGGAGAPDAPEEPERNRERGRAGDGGEGGERQGSQRQDGRDGAARPPAVVAETDGTGNGSSSIKLDRGAGEHRKESWWGRRSVGGGGGEMVFSTLHLLPRREVERRGSSTSGLPRLAGQAGRWSSRRAVGERGQVKSLQNSMLDLTIGSDSCVFLSPKALPRPPKRRTRFAADTDRPSCYIARSGLGLEVQMSKPSGHHQSVGQCFQGEARHSAHIFSPLPLGTQLKGSPSTRLAASAFITLNQSNQRHQSQDDSPSPRRAISSSGTSWRDVSKFTDPALSLGGIRKK